MEDTREKILTASEQLISKNGLAETTISMIARKSDITDSLVYQYFKGKEDLLFSIAQRNLKKVLELVDDQLQGIIDPISKLSKFIWYSLSYNEKNSDYARIMMFECHSNKNFYHSDAHEIQLAYFNRVDEILHQGMSENIFRKDLNTQLIKEIITGIIGAEIIDTLVAKTIETGSKAFNDIMALILPMIAAREPRVEKNKGSRILNAAQKVFSESGFSQAKISDIAKLARVAEGTIYEYFQSKDDLLLSIPNQRFEKYLMSLNGTGSPTDAADKLYRYLKNHIDFFLSDPDFLKVYILHIMLHPGFYGTSSYDRYAKYNKILDDIVEEGKQNGSFRENVNTRIFRRMFFGAFNYMAIRWFIREKDTVFDKMTEVNQLLDMMTCAIMQE